ncbi:hypothetical protein ACFY1U_50435 [Streptomyces sp. NPDC001351]|uniref:hypothetical protein n=1 Tax=Streptomyces sp. NPDC001351 TaxID=3364564 RepID=UPI0036CBED68
MNGHTREALRIAGRAIVPVDTHAEYLRHAQETGRADAVLPVPAEYWESFRSAIATLPTVTEIAARQWHGSVYVCDTAYAAVGEVLAGVTGRPLVHAPFTAALARSREEPVTVVGGLSVITPERFAALPADAQLGFFVTRTVAAGGALAVRTVLCGPAASQHWHDLSFDTVSIDEVTPRRLVGNAATPANLREAIGPGVAMLAGRSHARDCVMHLNGGGICGRASANPLLPLPMPDAADFREHPTACQQGQGCWRADVEVEQHLRAAELRAVFAVLDGCRLAVAGEGAVSAEVSVPLTMLENSTVAVATGTGIRKGVAYAGQLFQGLTRGGLPLGLALAEVNGVLDAEPDGLGRLVLFGDAGLAPVADGTIASVTCPPEGVRIAAQPAAVLVEGGPVMASGVGGPVVLTRPDGYTSWALTTVAGRPPGRVQLAPPRLDVLWTERVSGWLDRLQGLQSVGVQADFTVLDTVQRTAKEALLGRATATRVEEASEAVAAFESAVRELSRFQSRLVRGEIDWIRENFSSYVDGWRRPWAVEMSEEPRNCPQCGSCTAVDHRVRPSAGSGAEQLYLICARCGEVAAGSKDFELEVELLLASEVRRGTEFVLGVVLTAPAERPLSVSLGAAISNEPVVHCSLAASTDLELEAGERRVVEFTGTSNATRTRPDQHPLKVVVAADGAVRCWTRGLWLRA